MNQNKLTFQSENLVIDYISFNIPGSDNTESIAKYLFDHCNFNSTLFIEATGLKESFYSKPSNKDEIEFRIYYYNPKEKTFGKVHKSI